jgi:hypothetical protein
MAVSSRRSAERRSRWPFLREEAPIVDHDGRFFEKKRRTSITMAVSSRRKAERRSRWPLLREDGPIVDHDGRFFEKMGPS